MLYAELHGVLLSLTSEITLKDNIPAVDVSVNPSNATNVSFLHQYCQGKCLFQPKFKGYYPSDA